MPAVVYAIKRKNAMRVIIAVILLLAVCSDNNFPVKSPITVTGTSVLFDGGSRCLNFTDRTGERFTLIHKIHFFDMVFPESNSLQQRKAEFKETLLQTYDTTYVVQKGSVDEEKLVVMVEDAYERLQYETGDHGRETGSLDVITVTHAVKAVLDSYGYLYE